MAAPCPRLSYRVGAAGTWFSLRKPRCPSIRSTRKLTQHGASVVQCLQRSGNNIDNSVTVAQQVPVAVPDLQGMELRHTVKNQLLAAFASCLLLWSPSAIAQIQTVTASQATDMARSLPKQKVDKGKIWLVVVGGASFLFLMTIAVENYEGWFPAISRANKAMSMQNRKGSQEQQRLQEEQALLQAEQREVERQSRIVAEGLAEARNKVLGSPEAPGASMPGLQNGSAGPEGSLPAMVAAREGMQNWRAEQTATQSETVPQKE